MNVAQHYGDAIEAGRLEYQHCLRCDRPWLPPREFCPGCLAESYEWRAAAGTARLVSWIIYHVAYRPEFQNRLPYNVGLVELAEGPQLLTNVVELDAGSGSVREVDHARLRSGLALELAIARWADDQPRLPLFRVAAAG